MTSFVTIGELFSLAEQKIPSPAVDYLLGSAGSGQTFRRNRHALERLAIEQQVLIGHDDVSVETEFLGIALPSPALVAPMGSMAKLCPDGDLVMAKGVGRDGSMWAVPCMAAATPTEVAQVAPGPLLFQYYCSEGYSEDDKHKLLAEVEGLPAYKGVVITVDCPTQKRIDRYLEARPTRDPGRRTGRRPSACFTWDQMDHLRELVHLPMGLKGIMNAKDAVQALEHGSDFVWVSNHGGRYLDSGRATIDVLDEVVQAVAGRVPVIVDSGFRHGSDALKALAKGADLVAYGRVAACALGLDGADGVAAALQILRDEMKIALALSGRTSIQQLRAADIRPVVAPAP